MLKYVRRVGIWRKGMDGVPECVSEAFLVTLFTSWWDPVSFSLPVIHSSFLPSEIKNCSRLRTREDYRMSSSCRNRNVECITLNRSLVPKHSCIFNHYFSSYFTLTVDCEKDLFLFSFTVPNEEKQKKLYSFSWKGFTTHFCRCCMFSSSKTIQTELLSTSVLSEMHLHCKFINNIGYIWNVLILPVALFTIYRLLGVLL
jgi:hypothetical protein